MLRHRHSSGAKLNVRNRPPKEAHLIVEQFLAVGGDVPGFDFTTQVLIEHRLEEKMVFIVYEGNVTCAHQVEGREQTAKPAPNN